MIDVALTSSGPIAASGKSAKQVQSAINASSIYMVEWFGEWCCNVPRSVLNAIVFNSVLGRDVVVVVVYDSTEDINVLV